MKIVLVAIVLVNAIIGTAIILPPEDESCSPNLSKEVLSLVLENSSLVFDPPNETSSIDPGDIFCPSTKLSPPMKQKIIFIGLVGCEIDPLLAFRLEEDKSNGTNCSSSLPDSCPVPAQNAGIENLVPTNNSNNKVSRTKSAWKIITEYLITLLDTVSRLNNRRDLLPYHKICFRSVLTTAIPDFSILTSSVYEECIERNEVTVVIDMFWREISSYIHAALLPYAIPVLSFASSGRFQDLNVDQIRMILQGSKTETDTNQLEIEQIMTASNEYLFTMAPERARVVDMLDNLAGYFGWRIIGLVTVENTFFGEVVHTHEIHATHANFLAISYREGYLLQNFQPFIEKEIQVFVFHGYARDYLRLLHEAAKFDFINDHITWIYPYFDIIFPNNYAELWCEFTAEEVVVVKNALRGTLAVGLSTGIGKKYDHFIRRFPHLARRVTTSCGEECQRPRFIHTFYLHDMITVLAKVLNTVVTETANRLGITQQEVELVRNDSKLIVEKLREIHLLDSVTGQIQFTKNGKRNAFLFDIKNFVPINNSNFSVDTAVMEDPWVVQRRGTMTMHTDNNITFTFYTSDGKISNSSTVIFADGTTNIPFDHVVHFYIRESVSVTALFSSTIFLFVTSAVIFLTSIYYADQAARQLDSNGIYTDDDLTYVYGNAGDIHGKVLGYSRGIPGRRSEVAKLKKEGHLVSLTAGKFTRSLITKEVFLEIKKLRTMVHPNVAILYGCLVGEANAAFLHAYCSRGTLEDVLNNKELELDWIFSLSFGLDAAEGMSYLHSKRIIHGRLSTSACMINEQWTLKIKDYGLRELHQQTDEISSLLSFQRKGIKKNRTLPPEIRFFGGKATYETDIYTYGLVLKELTNKSWTNLEGFFKKSLLGSSIDTEVAQTNIKNDYFDEYISPKMLKIVKKCIDASPFSRPRFDWISTKLQQISYLFERKGQANINMLQIYSRRLEERLVDMGDLMIAERDYSNNVIRSYIPECMIVSGESGELQPLKKLLKTIICIEITNYEFLITKLDADDFNCIVVLIQKTLKGVLHNYNMNQLHTSGATWTITSVDDASVKSVQLAICAAQSLFDNLKDIPVPGYPDVRPTARAGLHAGDIFCGVVKQPIPKVVCFGANISTAVQLMLCSKDGRILVTSKLMFQMSMEENLTARSHIAMEIDNELMTTVWVEVPMTSCSPLSTRKLKPKPTSKEYDDPKLRVQSLRMRPFSDTGHRTTPASTLPALPLTSPGLSPSRAIFSDHSGNQFSTGKRVSSLAAKNNTIH